MVISILNLSYIAQLDLKANNDTILKTKQTSSKKEGKYVWPHFNECTANFLSVILSLHSWAWESTIYMHACPQPFQSKRFKYKIAFGSMAYYVMIGQT